MAQESNELFTVLETPVAYVQAFDAPADELFGVEGGIPGLYEERAQDDFEDVWDDGGFGGAADCRSNRCAVCRDYIGGHWWVLE